MSYGGGGYYDPYYDPYYYGGSPYYPYYPGFVPPLRPIRGGDRFDGKFPVHHGRQTPGGARAQGPRHHQGGQPARPLTPTQTRSSMAPPRR